MLAGLVLTAIGFAAPQTDSQADSFERGRVEWFDGNFASALKASKEQDQLLMIEFWADWCGW